MRASENRMDSKVFLLGSALLAWMSFAPAESCAQAWTDGHSRGKIEPLKGLEYSVEGQASYSKGKTPLWLNANKYGLSSLDEANGYVRASLIRPLQTDSARRWAVGYGVDVAVPYHFTSNFVVQQAYAEGRWLHGVLTVGSKQWPMELKNNNLSSGAQTLGKNARPVPQVRIALPDYWILPFANGWLRFKGHVAYGMMTDDGWQHEFTNRAKRYADNVLYHSKAGYLKIGNEDSFYPLSLELGLEMAAMFGGTSYVPLNGVMTPMKGEGGLKGMWNAFVPGGSDAGETVYKNISGDQVGSWLARINYDADTWRFSIYADKFFEDHSGMFQLDYDGYGEGAEWQKKKKSRYLIYDFKDIMLGAELNLKYGSWLRHAVFEYIYTKYQSGPINHDHTPSFSDHVAGIDNFYNHHLYTGWQHWGQVIGNPLYRSPIYNADGSISVADNRFLAFHLGVDGNLSENLAYRVLATYQEGFGTYRDPYTRKHHNVSAMAEATWSIKRGWTVRGAYAMDFGAILGNNAGFQLTFSKNGLLGL